MNAQMYRIFEFRILRLYDCYLSIALKVLGMLAIHIFLPMSHVHGAGKSIGKFEARNAAFEACNR